MKHISNIYDPYKPDAKEYHLFTNRAHRLGQDAIDREWESYLTWVRQYVIGRPKETEWCSVRYLENIGMIGLYEPIKLEGNENKDYKPGHITFTMKV